MRYVNNLSIALVAGLVGLVMAAFGENVIGAFGVRVVVGATSGAAVFFAGHAVKGWMGR